MLFGCLLGLSGCSAVSITQLVLDPDAGHSGPAPTSDAAVPPTENDGAVVPGARCGKRACACDDGQDNDQDGLVDGLDPECTGAFDDDEASFAIGKPNKQGSCRDCFWDDNAGSGDDDCRYPAECLSGAAVANGKGNCSSCQVSDRCLQTCKARTPNGCDCFGCCEVVSGASHVFIELSEDCALDRIADDKACPRCVPNTACQNSCGRCELCLGKQQKDLPADCATGAGGSAGYTCDEGQMRCTSSAECAGAAYCYLGCCLVELL